MTGNLRTMRAVAMDRFGGVETLEVRTVPVPPVGEDEVLIRVHHAGIGEWDLFEREGGYGQMLGIEPRFPYVLCSEGAGIIASRLHRLVDAGACHVQVAAVFPLEQPVEAHRALARHYLGKLVLRTR